MTRIVTLTPEYCKNSNYTIETKFEVVAKNDGVICLKNNLYPENPIKLVREKDIQDVE